MLDLNNNPSIVGPPVLLNLQLKLGTRTTFELYNWGTTCLSEIHLHFSPHYLISAIIFIIIMKMLIMMMMMTI